MRKVELTKVVGTCDSDLFKKMVESGDLTAVKVADSVGETIEVSGYAIAHITTDDKDFNIVYYATENGFIQSGSEWFLKSIENYYNDTKKFNIAKIKTSKGSTYKAVPVLSDKGTE